MSKGEEETGINFLELWAYYNLYKQLKYGSGGNYTTGGSIPASAPYLRTADSIDGVTAGQLGHLQAADHRSAIRWCFRSRCARRRRIPASRRCS